MSGAYYNEFDSDAAAWLRELIKQGHIADGEVDERDIRDVFPDDLRGFTQCHFFAGIGGWSYALRKAGWTDDRPVWTGSAPCQPFSAAGKGAAFADERHLWPAFDHLIKVCRPTVVFGEQVASAAVDDWIDLVHSDLEALGYAFGSIPFPSAGVGAPHIRDRNFWAAIAVGLADSNGTRLEGRQRNAKRSAKRVAGDGGMADGLANLQGYGQQGRPIRTGGRLPSLGTSDIGGSSRLAHGDSERCGETRSSGVSGGCAERTECDGDAGGMADNELQQRSHGKPGIRDINAAPGWEQSSAEVAGFRSDLRPGPTNGFWRDADWLGCRDNKWRPVEPGSFPLAYGLPVSMGKLDPRAQRLAALAGLDAASLKRAKSHRIIGLRGAGNAINAEAAIAWIRTVMECIA